MFVEELSPFETRCCELTAGLGSVRVSIDSSGPSRLT